MIEYLLIAVAFLIFVGVPAVRAGSRRHQRELTRNDNPYNATDPNSSTWSFGDSSSSRSDSGSCGSESYSLRKVRCVCSRVRSSSLNENMTACCS